MVVLHNRGVAHTEAQNPDPLSALATPVDHAVLDVPIDQVSDLVERAEKDCEIAAAFGVVLVFGQQILYIFKGEEPRLVLLHV